jgi:hypothetical protein
VRETVILYTACRLVKIKTARRHEIVGELRGPAARPNRTARFQAASWPRKILRQAFAIGLGQIETQLR